MNKLKHFWKNNKGYFYIAPAIIIIFIFVIYPVFHSFSMSFYTEYNIFEHKGSGFGFVNYIDVIQDAAFIKSIYNTFIFTIVVVPVSIIISLMLAVLLNSKIKGWQIFQTLYFIPHITNLIAIGFAFQFMFHSEYGILNMIITAFGGDAIQWLNDPKYSLSALIIFGIWSGLAFKIVVLLAGLQSIDKQYYEAAQIDGANEWHQFKNITVPLVAHILSYLAVISVIGSLKTYIEVVGLYGSKPGPANSALTIVYYVYDKFYGSHEYTVATAACVLLFIMILGITFFQQWLKKKYY